jgi:hypothetical protein
MPAVDGRGPEGRGLMSRGRHGSCGRGMGPGYGRKCGWLAVGYGHGGRAALDAELGSHLERRRTLLLAELARTDALLAGVPAVGQVRPSQGRNPWRSRF